MADDGGLEARLVCKLDAELDSEPDEELIDGLDGGDDKEFENVAGRYATFRGSNALFDVLFGRRGVDRNWRS